MKRTYLRLLELEVQGMHREPTPCFECGTDAVPCPDCDGAGCSSCKGEGQVDWQRGMPIPEAKLGQEPIPGSPCVVCGKEGLTLSLVHAWSPTEGCMHLFACQGCLAGE